MKFKQTKMRKIILKKEFIVLFIFGQLLIPNNLFSSVGDIRINILWQMCDDIKYLTQNVDYNKDGINIFSSFLSVSKTTYIPQKAGA